MRSAFLAMALLAAAAQPSPAPTAPRRAVTDEYHGVRVVDEYRWLENGEDPAVKTWMDAQNERARDYLSGLARAKEIKARVTELMTAAPPEYYGMVEGGGRLFAIKSQPPKQQPFLVLLNSPDDASSEKTLVDPNAIDAKGATAVDFYRPSLDGRKVAVSLSRNGTEEGDVRVYDVATGRELGDMVPRVNGGTAGGAVAWNADATGFWYSRYPRGSERPAADMAFYTQVWFHRLGTQTGDDVYCLGKEFPRIAEIGLDTSDDGKHVLVRVANGDGGEFAYWLRGPDDKWTRFATYEDKVIRAAFAGDGKVYLLSRRNAPNGTVLRLDPAAPELSKAATVVETSKDASIQSMAATKTRLYVVDLVGGPSRLRVFDLERGGLKRTIPILPVSSVGEVTRLDGDDVLFSNQSFTDPQSWYRIHGADGEPVKTAMSTASPVDFSDTEVVREYALSKDGTRVPLNILRRKGARLDHSNPTLLAGYGGFGIAMRPFFSALKRIWLEQGGVFAIANLRGGGEYGEEWHLAGRLTKKQNVFDDFYACGAWLIEHGYTSHQKLALMGGSNGGLLMGATLTQHPDLARAVVSFVGLYDMLRVERHPNGAFNVTEFGTVKDPEQWKALYAYSPYHHVVDGTKYPAVLLTTGVNDPRVDPANSRKMTARLQAASGSKGPVLLRVTQAGHGIGSSLDEEIAEQSDVYAFLFDQLGMK